ncbi:histidine kinase [Paenibacillus sp. ACRRX]|uniref:sensor histidine kinase n=1 Tax=unclassified Paenibacillus TaxID=185978 RepID=UPI001EF62F84|nr:MULTISPECIES: histidine kinase [unclassified Paenibacillus]MCG7408441.1 histidine kinase [Paenibacillus sp. ACRRX]MDK8182679.1 histidine kinase [Paenibacillus sp. UMB4589-SE434]
MRSLQRKITYYVGGCFALLFMALLVTIHLEMESTVIPLNKSLTQQIVNARSDQIAYWFEQRVGEVDLLASLASEHRWGKKELLHEIEQLVKTRKEAYESIRVVDIAGNSCSLHDKPFSIVLRPYYQKLLESDKAYVISDVIRSHANQADIVVILHRVEPLVDDEVAYIAAAVPIGKMQDIAKDIYVYDGMGKLLVGDQFDAKLNDTSKGAEQMALFTAAIRNVPGWSLTFQLPKSQLSQGMKQMQRSALLTGSVIGIFLLVLLMLLAASIVKPIRALQRVMKKVEDGNQSVRSNEQRNDEIGELGRSFNQMLVKLYRYEHEKKEMELRLIQEQIKPHFLYNTLDTIQWMAAGHGADDVVGMVEALSTYFRLGLGGGSQYITLEQEFHHVESYLHIQCVRYEEILEYELFYDECLGHYPIIRFLLQPLVENAIYHGIKPLVNRKSKISICAYEREHCFMIEVANNGVDIPEAALASIQEALLAGIPQKGVLGFGLYSVDHRLRLAYGEPYGLHIQSGEGSTRMLLTLPLEGRHHVERYDH